MSALRVLIGALLLSPPPGSAPEEPVATLAVLSNLYLTALPAGKIRDARGGDRGWLAKEGPRSMERTLALLEQLKPDAVVVLGSVTWTGSPEDVDKAAEFLDRIRPPLWITGGPLDRKTDSGEPLKKRFADALTAGNARSVKGVRLLFSDKDTDTPKAKGVLFFGARPEGEAFEPFIKQQHVALRLDDTRYGQRIACEGSLPVWTVGSTAWSARGAVSLIRVFDDRIEAAEVRNASAPVYTLTVPNPLNRPRITPAADDPYGCPSYSEDLKGKPDLTFALVSDPQFDRVKNRETLLRKARAAVAELNRLAPGRVLITGDLVNNNLPDEWALFNEVFSTLKPARTVMPGNHDVIFNSTFVEKMYEKYQTSNPEYAAEVRKAVEEAGREGFKGPEALYEKFTGQKSRQDVEQAGCRFITLGLITQKAGAADLEHLRASLEKPSSARHVFVLGHYPVLPAFGNNVQPALGGDAVLDLLKKHRVTAFLFGHRHRNGFRMHEGTAHVLSDNMGSIHLFHVFKDRVVVGRKQVGSPLYPRLVLPVAR